MEPNGHTTETSGSNSKFRNVLMNDSKQIKGIANNTEAQFAFVCVFVYLFVLKRMRYKIGRRNEIVYRMKSTIRTTNTNASHAHTTAAYIHISQCLSFTIFDLWNLGK